MKLVAIIQARLASTRLPEKVLMDIKGKPMLWHIVKRVSQTKLVDELVIATSTSRKDNKIEKFAKENNFNIFRGLENDCLDRYYQSAKKAKAEVV